ncbi:Electron transport complex protein RnfB [Lachnospiraceae bacterium TWA4]|nr:Electron transport complex protein RnfB [Lachnospiraceae bacterium TWA4]
MSIGIAAVCVGAVGVIVALLLGIAGEAFKVEVDERVIAVRGELPGNNCGGCGYPGCDGLAEAIVKGEAAVNQCPVGGAAVGEKIAAIMGVEAAAGERKVAFVKCKGTCEVAGKKYNYYGVDDCLKAVVVPGGGAKACSYGCLGLGSCVKECGFGALKIVDGVAKVDESACVACGKCAAICPKQLIDLVPESATHRVECSSKDKGKQAKAVCDASCIGCGVCEKKCPKDAIHVENNIAIIDYDKCDRCGTCAEKCPRKAIS